MFFFECAYQQSLGRRLKQEDTILSWRSNSLDVFKENKITQRKLLTILGDGLGGHVGGEVASQIVCSTFCEVFQKSEDGQVSDNFKKALYAANRKISEIGLQKPHFLGMGSTLLAVIFFEKSMQWISVGDSLLYLFRNGKITILNDDHSLNPQFERENAERGFDATNNIGDQRRNVLRSALTGAKILLIDFACCPLELNNFDYIVLASDGILTLSFAEIEKTLALNAKYGPKSVAQSIIEVIDRMNDPHQDNTSVVVVRPIDAPLKPMEES